MNDLINTIKNLSEILHFLVVNKELTDIEVVLCCQELDKLPLQYEKKMNLK